MFKIEFTSEIQKSNPPIIYGRITIGKFQESFISSLIYWNVNDYLNQWKETFKEAIKNTKFSGCLITSMVKPIKKNYLFCWPIYRENEKIYIQNQILFLKYIKGKFDIKKLGEYVSPRTTIDEDGDKISEWKISIEELEYFYNELKKLS